MVAVAIAAALAAGALASGAKRPHISSATAIILPSTSVCVTGHSLTFRLRSLHGVRWRMVTVSVNGRHFETLKLARPLRPVTLEGLPSGSFVLKLEAYTSDGRSATAKRKYAACAPKHHLTVVPAGTGSGTVTGGGISCPGTCSRTYTAGTMVTLTASPASGSSFSGWSGGGCSGTGTCTLTMNSDRTVTASFAASHTLTVSLAGSGSGTVTGSGISCPGTCSHSYAAGSTTTLTAAAASGSSFSGWSGGGCSGTGICTVTMSSDKTVTATFAATHTLTVSLAGTGSGTVTGGGVSCPGSCTKMFAGGTMVTLAASPGSSSSFAGWSGGGCSGIGTCTVTMSSDQSVTATFTAAATGGPEPGSYSGHTSQSISFNDVSLYVSPDGAQVEDATIEEVAVACTPSTPSPNPSPFASFDIPATPINADGSFSTMTTETTVIGNAAVHITYTFSGQFTGTSIAGSFQEDISYDGTTTTCTSGDQTWSATRDTQGSQASLIGPVGSYAGTTSQAISFNDVSFYVSSDKSSLQDVTIEEVGLSCTPSTPSPNPSPWGSFDIASIPINADGSFAATSTETTVVANAPVHVTYTFSGHFHGENNTPTERVAGTMREDISYDGTSTTCTSGNQFWSALWQTQGNQAALAPPAGSYAGNTSQAISFNDVSMFVSPDQSQLQDITIEEVGLSCTPSTPSPNPSPQASFYIPSIPINADGSFSNTTTVTGVIGNAAVHITYTFSGHFHGQNTSNQERAAGTVREDLTYDGASIACTSGNQFWSAVWQTQGNQAALAPPAGSYAGNTSQAISFNDVSLYVSSDRSKLQDVTIEEVGLACNPSTPSPNPSPYASFYIPSIAINADGSFSTTSTETTVIGNAAVHVTYTFTGHFNGRNSSNNERVDGSFREDVSYDGTATTCTSGTQSWSALWQTQGNQAALAPPAGSYAGNTSQAISFNDVAFTVSSDGTELQNVTIEEVGLACTPSTPSHNPSPDGSFAIASIPINSDGSFSETMTEAGVENGAPVHFTYTFTGNVHGQNSSNKERVAGSFREDVTYDGTSTSCTSGVQSWTATQQ